MTELVCLDFMINVSFVLFFILIKLSLSTGISKRTYCFIRDTSYLRIFDLDLGKVENSESEEEGTRHFMVNVIEPQFNLHSEEANVSNYCLRRMDIRHHYLF